MNESSTWIQYAVNTCVASDGAFWIRLLGTG